MILGAAIRRAAAGLRRMRPSPVLPTGGAGGEALARAVGHGYWPSILTVSPYPSTARRSTVGANLYFAPPTPSYQLWVGSRNLSATSNLREGTLNIAMQTGAFRTLNFQSFSQPLGGYEPARDEDVRYYDRNGNLMFQGFVDTITRHNDSVNGMYVDCKCIDMGMMGTRRTFSASYASPVDTDTIARDAMAVLADLGVVFVPNAMLSVTLAGPDPVQFDLSYVNDVMNSLAAASNTNWTIDENLNAFFFSPVSGSSPAPIDFTDTTIDGEASWMTYQDNIIGVRFANSVWVTSQVSVATMVTDVDPGDPSGNYTVAYPLNSTPTILVNSVAQFVVEAAQVASNPGYDFVYSLGSLIVQYNPSRTPLSSSDVVEITYINPVGNYKAHAFDPASIAARGLFETIIDGGPITSKAQLDAIATAELARLLATPHTPTITGSSNGWKSALDRLRPGQSILVDISNSGINSTFYIQKITFKQAVSKFFYVTVTVSSDPWAGFGNGASFFRNLIQSSVAPTGTTAIQFSIAQTIEGDPNPGVLVGLKPQIVTAQTDGAAAFARITWNPLTPPVTGVTLDVLKNGVSIFSAPITCIAGGITARFLTFSSSPLNIKEGDVFTVDIITGDVNAMDGFLEIVYQ